ncbi:hypothetical protein EG68_06754 [Paragonimus skrjabini miyazakii]|uniref:Uncharacterized protein n=1 Tax=Paragonimus skrjabini miyazakii TaxID=59628 RepID=A0A8S9YLB3_9TREM|nr:hypothetical protein EG68_06754 [Paragonimus skrjabini miyazakii]
MGFTNTSSQKTAHSNHAVRHIPAGLHCPSHELARRYSNAAERHQEEYHDKKAHEAPLVVGAEVYLHTDVPSSGVLANLRREWEGPFVVERVFSETLCYIRITDGCQKPMVIPFNRLKPAEAPKEAKESEGVPRVGADVEISNDELGCSDQ